MLPPLLLLRFNHVNLACGRRPFAVGTCHLCFPSGPSGPLLPTGHMQPAGAPCHADPSHPPPGSLRVSPQPSSAPCPGAVPLPAPGSRATFHRHCPFFWEAGKPGSTPPLLLTGWVTLRGSPALFGLRFPTCEERRRCGLLFLGSRFFLHLEGALPHLGSRRGGRGRRDSMCVGYLPALSSLRGSAGGASAPLTFSQCSAALLPAP